MEIEGFGKNPPNRCYLCKRELFEKIREIAKRENIKTIAEGSNLLSYHEFVHALDEIQDPKATVAEGSNLDDDGDYRPGLQAVAEFGIKSPLRNSGMSKADIRILSAGHCCFP